MSEYEMTYILKAQHSEAEWEASRKYVNDWITSHEGVIQKDDVWGMRPLATELAGERQGYFVVIDFTLPPQHVSEFKFNLNIHERMFRYILTTRIPEPVPKIK